jgi:Phage endonuclease I
MVTRATKGSKRANALKAGWRSGLEEDVAKALTEAGVPFTYEEIKIKYIKPASEHQYTPDFQLDNGIIVETKGRFLIADRKKHMLIKRQQPHLDIRFVFSNSSQKLNKGSRTSYAQWCVKNGFLYSDKTIPNSWINETQKRSI